VEQVPFVPYVFSRISVLFDVVGKFFELIPVKNKVEEL
jgi:hypothetical protein